MSTSTSNSKVKEKLKLKNFKLNTLLELTNAINNNLSKKDLLLIFREVLVEKLHIGKISLYIFDNKWNLEMKYGHEKKRIKIDIEKDLLHIEKITVMNTNSNEHLASFDVAVPIFHDSAPLAYLLLGDFAGEQIAVSPIIKHLPFIQTLTNVITVALENKRLYMESLKQAALKRELELASKMQSMLIPDVLPHNEKLELAAFYKPHQQIGGDYYDFVQLNKDEIAFCMADVSGKGISAALLMSNFQANVKALMEVSDSLEDLIISLNERILESAKGEKFITFFVGKYVISTRELTYVNAGHNPPFLVNGKELKELQEGCTILGMFDKIPNIKVGREILSEKAMIVTYTDGVIEIENNKEEQFGMDRLGDTILKGASGSMKKTLDTIFKNIEQHRGKMGYVDDIALLGCRFH